MSRTLSLSTSSINPMVAETAFQAATQVGYDGIELMISPSRDIQNVNYIKDLIQKYSIPVTSIHAPTLLLCKFVWGVEPGGKLMRSVDFAEKVGASSVVVHPPFKNNPYSTQLFQHVRKVNDNTSVDVAVENMFPWMVRGREKEIYGPSWAETCENVDNLTFDFSHASLSRMDVMEFFHRYHHKVRIIHLTDGSTRNQHKHDIIKDEHLLPGKGHMPIREVYELLNKVGWQGETVLEINTRQNKKLQDKIPALTESLNFFHSVANS
jgi:sugar phosphate isomerase/epimerase